MKKIIILILVSSIAKTVIAQTPITDTIAYLRDSVQARKTYYINKPLSVLLNDLKVQINSCLGEVPFKHLPDTITCSMTNLYFFSSSVTINRHNSNLKSPFITIQFANPVQIPKLYLEKGALLDWTTNWTPGKASFFGSYIISDLVVRGL